MRVVATMVTQSHRLEQSVIAANSLRGQVDLVKIHQQDMVGAWHDTRGYKGDVELSASRLNFGAEVRYDIPEIQEPKGHDMLILGVDDDIIYPPDYVETMLAQDWTRTSVYGVHASILRGERWQDREVIHFTKASHRRAVDVLGGGTVAIRMPAFGAWSYPDDVAMNIDDVVLGLECKRRGVKPWCVDRPAGWLQPIETTGPTIHDSQAVDGYAARNEFLKGWK